MSNLRLTLACGPYDRTQALRDGTITPEGIELNYITLQPAEIFWRMLQYREFDVSEMSLSNYTSLVSGGNAPFIAIPVFPSRVFRHGYFFINTSAGIEKPADLAGKRGGVPEYSMTAAVYMRGLLQHEFGVKPNQVEWIQGRADRLGRTLPSDIKLTQAPAGTELGDLLDKGEIDFLMTANNPLSFRRGSPNVKRLFPNYMELEKDYYRRTKIYPIMHTVVIRREIYDRDPWVALSLYKAFARAKEYSFRLLLETGVTQGLIRLAAAHDRAGTGDHRQGLVSLWHRREPTDHRGLAAIHGGARPVGPPACGRRIVRAEYAARYSAERRPARVAPEAASTWIAP